MRIAGRQAEVKCRLWECRAVAPIAVLLVLVIACAEGYAGASAARPLGGLRVAQAPATAGSEEEEPVVVDQEDLEDPTVDSQDNEAVETTAESEEPPADEALEEAPEEPAADKALEEAPEEPAADETVEEVPEEAPADETVEEVPEELPADEALEEAPEEPPADETVQEAPEEPPAGERPEQTPESEEPPAADTPSPALAPKPVQKASQLSPEPDSLEGKNEIKNGDFESEYKIAPPLSSCITPAHRGLCAAELTYDSKKRPPFFVTSPVPLSGAKGFTAEAWTYTQRIDHGAFFLAFWAEDAEKKRVAAPRWEGILAPEEGWTRHRIHIKASELPATTVTVAIYAFWYADGDSPPSGTAYLDDLAIVLD